MEAASVAADRATNARRDAWMWLMADGVVNGSLLDRLRRHGDYLVDEDLIGRS
jgi:hypothetical protein